MDKIIRKELLSEVLRERIRRHDSAFLEVVESAISDSDLHVNYQNAHGIICLFIINIHELAFEYKKWAITKHKLDFHISQKWLGVGTIICEFKSANTGLPLNTVELEQISSNEICATDFLNPIYTFKACQWILDNKGKK